MICTGTCTSIDQSSLHQITDCLLVFHSAMMMLVGWLPSILSSHKDKHHSEASNINSQEGNFLTCSAVENGSRYGWLNTGNCFVGRRCYGPVFVICLFANLHAVKRGAWSPQVQKSRSGFRSLKCKK